MNHSDRLVTTKANESKSVISNKLPEWIKWKN